MRSLRTPFLLVVLALAVAVGLASCGDDADDGEASDGRVDVPFRAPEVSGTLSLVADDLSPVRLVDASDPYFEGMGLLRPVGPDGEVLVVDESGALLAVDDLVEGMHVDVWVGSACAESYPVQCGIEALRVDTGLGG